MNDINRIFDQNMKDGVRVDKTLRELNRTLNSTKSTLEQGIGQGAINPSEYCAILKEIMVKD